MPGAINSRVGLLSYFNFSTNALGTIGGPPIPVALRAHLPRTELCLFEKVWDDTSPTRLDPDVMPSIPMELLRLLIVNYEGSAPALTFSFQCMSKVSCY